MKFVISLLALALLSTGCLKKDSGCSYADNPVVAPVSEEQMVKAYLDSMGINATKHSSNLYYEILEPGAGTTPGLCNEIVIGYTGKFTSGAVFENVETTIYVLGSLIEGWKKGIPLIKTGGKIRLYIPPSLAYGNNDIEDRNGNVVIPGGSILIFEINLFDVR